MRQKIGHTCSLPNSTQKVSRKGGRVTEGRVHLFKVPSSGGQPVQVSDLQINIQVLSNRGDRIAVQYYDDKASQWKVGILSAADGKTLQPVDVSLATQGSIHT